MAATATASARPRYAPEDPTLPKPWRGLVDGKTGYLYFWNPETNVTQYERPSAPPVSSKSSSLPVSSSVQVEPQSSSCECNPVKEVDSYGIEDNGGSEPAVRTDFDQGSRGGANPSQNDPSRMVNGPAGSSAGEHGSSSAACGLSPEAYCHQHEISVIGDKVPPPLTSFEAAGFPPEILREVKSAGFSSPTPIQAQSWPIAMQGRDIVAIAKTGSGKTLGYLVPGFFHIKRRHNDPKMGPTVLVLSPTRELATQIQDEAVKFGKSSRISCTCLYGGAPKGPQLKELDRGVDIVVATPGRLNDILEMRRISLIQVSYLVLDEADRMLDMGFEPQIRKIVTEVPSRRQTLMYTATWPKEVRKIAADLLVNPVQVNIGNVDELVANKSITQYVEVLPHMEKHRRLEQILRSQEPGSKIIIFCSTKKMCDQLARNLTRQFGAAAIHGDKSQSERDNVLSQFRSGRSPVLVATDVAARGLDIKDIRVVINYDFPTGVEDYVHRIGRTGRAGATGVAYTFFGDHDAKHASDLVKVLEGANQNVPPEVRDMASRVGGMSKFRRWGSSSGGRDGGPGGRGDYGCGKDSGRGSFGMSNSYSNRFEHGGGHGYDYGSKDRYDGGRSRSPGNASGWSDHTRSGNCDRSPSPDKAPSTCFPVRSFHQAMMERSRVSSPPQNQRERSRSPLGGRGSSLPCASTHEWSPVRSFHKLMMEKDRISQPSHDQHDRSGSHGGGRPGSGHGENVHDDGSHSNFEEKEEEGMIPNDEDAYRSNLQ